VGASGHLRDGLCGPFDLGVGSGPSFDDAGTQLRTAEKEALEERLREMPRRLERLKKSGLKRPSRTDPDSRFLPARGKFTLGYTAPVAVSVKIL